MTRSGGDNFLPSTSYWANGELAHSKNDLDSIARPSFLAPHVATPLWAKCEDETHTPKSGNWESSGTLATSELNSRGQNTSP